MTETTDRSGVLPKLEVILGRIAELEMRLRERIDESAELTEQVRCLEAERKIRDEYLGSIEVVAVRLDEVDRERIAIEASASHAATTVQRVSSRRRGHDRRVTSSAGRRPRPTGGVDEPSR